MNKRIQELSLLCYEEVGHYDMGSIPVFNHAKFAKMIVGECLNELCNQMDLHGVDLSNLPSWYKALEQTEKCFQIEK